MNKLFYILMGLGIAATGIAYAAPTTTPLRTIYPEATNTYELGTSTRAWISGTFTTLCLTLDSCINQWPSGGGGGGGASTTIAGLSPSNGVYLFATGTAGTTFNISTATPRTITFNLPFADATHAGQLQAADWTTFNNKVATSRTITAGTGLTGGGDLSADRTISLITPVTVTNGGIGTTTLGTLTVGTGLSVTGGQSVLIGTSTQVSLGSSVVTSVNNDTNVTGSISANALTLGWTGQLGVTRGGTGLASVSQGDLLYGSASNAISALSKDTNATRYLSNTGSSNNPAWAQVNLANGVTGILPIANGGINTSTAPSNNALIVGNGTTYVQAILPSCSDTTNSKLLYNNSTFAFSCGTDQSGGGGSVSGGKVGWVATWASSTSLTFGTLIDNGTVAGANATSSTVNFLIQGTGTNNAFQVNSSTGTSLVTVTPAGNIGIGTTNPTAVNANARVTVAGTGSQDYIASTTDNTTLSDAIYNAYAPGSRIFIGAHGANQTANRAGIVLGGWGEIGGFNNGTTINGLLIDVNAASPMVLATNNAERLRITSTGLVGVGSSTPIATLSVQGSTTLPTTDIFSTASSSGAAVLRVTAGLNVNIATLTATSLVASDANKNLQSVTLTTTGSSGAATFSGSTLNIPQYAGGGVPAGLNNQVQINANGLFGGSTFYSASTTASFAINSSTPNSTFLVQGTSTQPSRPILTVASSSGQTVFQIGSDNKIVLQDEVTPSFLSQKDITLLSNQAGGGVRVIRDIGSSILTNTGYNTYDIQAYTPSSTLTSWPNLTGPCQTFSIATSSMINTIADICAFRNTNDTTSKLSFRPYLSGSANAVPSLTLDGFNATAGIGSSTPWANLVVQSGSGGTVPILVVATSTGVQLLTVLANGNVGIGSSTPSSAFVVDGSDSSTTQPVIVRIGGPNKNSQAPMGCMALYDKGAGNYVYMKFNSGTFTTSTSVTICQ